jgi:Ca2+-binding RTX toxin-like protein
LTNNSAEDINPAFSPDGREILFQTDRGGSKDIYVMQRDGSDQRIMYASSGTEENPEWAPSTLTCDHKQVTVLGTPGNDNLVGTSQNDVIIGGGGSDRITGGAGNDTICSGKGDDTITAGPGSDKLWGAAGADTLQGRGGADFLNGGPGHDLCNGAGGTDRGKLCERRHSIP